MTQTCDRCGKAHRRLDLQAGEFVCPTCRSTSGRRSCARCGAKDHLERCITNGRAPRYLCERCLAKMTK